MKTKKITPSVVAARTSSRPEPTCEEIAASARSLWEKRGRPSGQDDQIWLEAERRLRNGESDRDGEKSFADPKRLLNTAKDTASRVAFTIRYKIKPGYREQLMPELKKILDLCANEPEFLLAFLQESAERPNELRIFEVWKGTKEDFERVQSPKPYRRAYLEKTKAMVANVEVEQNSVIGTWVGD
jgi:quinol monooxygenase YgiN